MPMVNSDGELPSKWQIAKAEKNVLSEAASLDTKILVESFRYKNNHIIQMNLLALWLCLVQREFPQKRA